MYSIVDSITILHTGPLHKICGGITILSLRNDNGDMTRVMLLPGRVWMRTRVTMTAATCVSCHCQGGRGVDEASEQTNKSKAAQLCRLVCAFGRVGAQGRMRAKGVNECKMATCTCRAVSSVRSVLGGWVRAEVRAKMRASG